MTITDTRDTSSGAHHYLCGDFFRSAVANHVYGTVSLLIVYESLEGFASLVMKPYSLFSPLRKVWCWTKSLPAVWCESLTRI